MKKKNGRKYGLISRSIAWLLSLLLVLSLLGSLALGAVQMLLTDTALHERVALSTSVVDRQMERVEARVLELAEQQHFSPETALNIVTRESVMQFSREVIAWWTGMFQEEPDLTLPEYDTSEVQAAVRADPLFQEHTSESMRLRVARDEVAYEIGLAVHDAALPIRVSLVELAAPVVLGYVNVPGLLSLMDLAKNALLIAAFVLAALVLLVLRGPGGAVYVGGAAAAAGLLLLCAALGMTVLNLPGMVQPLSEMLTLQVKALGNEMLRWTLIKGGALLAGGQVLAALVLRLERRGRKKTA